MPKQQIPLIKGDKIDANTDYRDALPMNMLVIPKPILDAAGYMLCHPGLTQFGTAPGADRGGVYNDQQGTHFRVSGQKLVSIDTAGVMTVLGTISGSSQAAMPYSTSTQAVIVDGKYYLYDTTAGFRQVTDIDLGTPLDAEWIDGYYFFTDGLNIFHTDLTDEAQIDPLKYSTADFMPDPVLGIGKTQDDKVMVFGRYSIEYFLNAGTTDFAFTRISNRAQKIGIVATHAKVEVQGQFFITGSRKQESLGVHVVGVGSSTKISTREIDKILAQYTDADLIDMRMESRSEEDIELVYIHLPNECLCFNITASQGFGKEMAWSIVTTGKLEKSWRAINGVYDPRNHKWVYGDKTEWFSCYLDHTVFTQYGVASEWLLYTPFMNMETMSIDEIEMQTIPGNTVFDDATLAFSMTKDGQNWSMEWWSMYGEPLDYNHRYIVRRLGTVNEWVGLRFRSVTKSRMAFSGLSVTYG